VPEITLRFYGRFVFAEPHVDGKPLGRLSVLAPNMQYGDSRRCRHEVLMSIPRPLLVPQRTKIPPNHKMLTAGPADKADYFIWDLSGSEVAIAGDKSFTFTDRKLLSDLGELEWLQGRTAVFNSDSLHATEKGAVSSVIQLEAGSGTASFVFNKEFDFVPMGPRKPFAFEEFRPLADLVEVTLEVPKDANVLSISVTTSTGVGNKLSTITRPVTVHWNEKLADLATISFTNLCGTIPRFERWDEEFSQYYEVLQNAPEHNRRLIPEEAPVGGEGGDCNKGAYVGYDVTSNAVLRGSKDIVAPTS
jgi:hypothetical protein